MIPLSNVFIILSIFNVIWSGIHSDFWDWWHHTNEELSFWQSWNSIST